MRILLVLLCCLGLSGCFLQRPYVDPMDNAIPIDVLLPHPEAMSYTATAMIDLEGMHLGDYTVADIEYLFKRRGIAITNTRYDGERLYLTVQFIKPSALDYLRKKFWFDAKIESR